MADVAQLVRAPACGAGGRGFKSHHSPHRDYYTKTPSSVSFSLLIITAGRARVVDMFAMINLCIPQ